MVLPQRPLTENTSLPPRAYFLFLLFFSNFQFYLLKFLIFKFNYNSNSNFKTKPPNKTKQKVTPTSTA